MLIGEEIIALPGFNCLRNLQNPKSNTAAEGQHPNTYQGQFWSNTGDVSTDSHFNSTVLSHWFYLLSIGGNGTNDNNNCYQVSGISIIEAANIVYRAESFYLNSSANYAAARIAMINAATDLYGSTSNEVAQVTNAWYAVGVGNAYQNTISGPSLICTTGTYTVNNLPQGASVTWASSNPSGISIGATTGVASRVGSFQGSVTISATVNSSCNPVTLTVTVSTGSLPYFTSSTPIVGPSQITVGSSANYHIDAVSGQTSYSWSVTSNWQIFGIPTLQVCEVIANAPAATKTLTFTATNVCGTVAASKSIQSITAGGGGGGGCDAVAIATYPNPSKAGDITVDILPPGGGCNPSVSVATTGTESTTSTERVASTPDATEGAMITLAPTTTANEGAVVIYNSMGNEVFKSSYTGEAITLSGLNLKPGIYYIHVMYKDKEYQKRLVVE